VPHEDRILVRRTLAGEPAAFADLVRKYEGAMQRFVTRMTKDPEVARDLTQEAFIRVYQALSRYDERYPFKSWLYKIASNLCIDHLRRERFRAYSFEDVPKGGQSELPRQPVDEGKTPLDVAADSETRRFIEEALEELTPEHREVLNLLHRDGLAYEEIAARLDVPLGTVKARIHRARKALKGILAPRLGRTPEGGTDA